MLYGPRRPVWIDTEVDTTSNNHLKRFYRVVAVSQDAMIPPLSSQDAKNLEAAQGWAISLRLEGLSR